jgi:hypothetical protein
MSHADVSIIIFFIIALGYELDAIRKYTRDCFDELKEIRKEISSEFEKTPSGLKLTSWGLKEIGEGIRSDVKELKDCLGELRKIREDISCEYEKSPSGLKLTRWGLKEIGEGIRSDLKEIQEEIRSK